METYVAIINVPGYLPEEEAPTFTSARLAWEYLLEERNRFEDEWFDDAVDEPKYSVTSDQIHTMWERAAWERMATEDWDGTGSVTGPDPSNPNKAWAYEVQIVEADL